MFGRSNPAPPPLGGSKNGTPGRRRDLAGAIIAVVMLLAVSVLAAGTGVGKAAESKVIVSLTFDDGRANQYSTLVPLKAHAMRGTFYVNSGIVGWDANYMTWDQLRALAVAGNEIAGHSIFHRHLTTLTPAEQQHEICDDRTQILNHGFSPVISFAYPFAEYDAAVKSVVMSCGYQSARSVGGLRSSTCNGCPFAEAIPPLDRWALRTPIDVDLGVSLANMQGWVTQAENNGGGWVIFVFHSVCDGGPSPTCDGQSISPGRFTAFLDWLLPRAARGTVVQTVGQVSRSSLPSDTTPPVTKIACNGTKCSNQAYSSPVTVTLSATDSGFGVASTRYTTDGTDPTNGLVYSGPFIVSSTTTVLFRSTDRAGNVERVRSELIRFP